MPYAPANTLGASSHDCDTTVKVHFSNFIEPRFFEATRFCLPSVCMFTHLKDGGAAEERSRCQWGIRGEAEHAPSSRCNRSRKPGRRIRNWNGSESCDTSAEG